MPSALTPIAWQSLGSSAATVTFSSIPGTYRDLMLVMNPIGVSVTDYYVRFNGDATNVYTAVWMYGTGAGTGGSSVTNTGLYAAVAHSVPTTAGFYSKMDIMDYSATDKHKTVLTRADLASGSTDAFAQRWPNTAAVTSISCVVAGANFAAGSTFALYGVSA